jgi:hypothetical protein
MNRFTVCAIALTCFGLPRSVLADRSLAPRATSSAANESPPPAGEVETSETHMRSPPTAIAGGVLLGLGVIGVGAGVGLIVGGNSNGNWGDGILGVFILGTVGHLTVPGAIMLGVGASPVHGQRMARDPKSVPTISLDVTPSGIAFRGTF